jgi:hypothetical protein
VNLYGCRIGDETRIGTFVEIQKGASIGSRCKMSVTELLLSTTATPAPSTPTVHRRRRLTGNASPRS